jgi:dTDP-4-amino-4,6-dideoxygalactose transaminase
VGAINEIGARPVFVDCDDSFCMDVSQVEAAITPRTKAIMPVHLFGQVAAMDEINRIAGARGIAVVEDAAQAVGAEYQGRRAGTLGELACFSFFPSKNLGAFGDAGAVTTDAAALAEKLVDYRMHGMRPKYVHHVVGGNFRIDALQAAILGVKLPHLDAWSEGRRRNARTYEELFADANLGERVALPREVPGRRHIYNQFCIRFPEGRAVRDRVMEHLKSAGIGCEVYYPLTLPQQKCFADVPSSREPFPNSDAGAEQSLAIPIYAELERDQLAEVVREVGRGLGG